ncbi:hypothetical protein FZ929_21960 [Klebsiella pneumoniae]|uniref:Uncharacterized protein n=1 Tax=Klebsiella pneumoniae TaxID=573 RepID=A0A5C2LIW6_KLEPN|nr:hypothetical protein FZ929_21960 [Klebsiella pneumoniae]
MKSLNSVVDIIDSQQDEKNRRRVPESTFFALTKTAVNRKWICLSALFDLICYISNAYLIDFVVNNYN